MLFALNDISKLARSWRNIALLLFVIGAPLAGCATVDLDTPRETSEAIDPATDTRLKRGVDDWLAENPGPSGFFPLVNGRDALGARLYLMETAEKTIDIQYFLMKPDTAGIAFTVGLLRAADRGVKVRFLLDDIFTTIDDRALLLLDHHENIEVRLYNPVAGRGAKMFSFLTDFKRANRRMHNKSFTADNQVTIVGGRNIADEYFEIHTRGEFWDLDVIGIGPVAAEVSEAFDLFWNDRRSLPLAAVVKSPGDAKPEALPIEVRNGQREEVQKIMKEYRDGLVAALAEPEQPFYSADSSIITDEPEKLENRPGGEYALLAQELLVAFDAAHSEVFVLTPYFVPRQRGVEFWGGLVARGVRVVMVTNSLASNNHTAVHSGYSRYRRKVLEAGVELYEVRVDAGQDVNEPVTLHTKAFVFDRERVFIGSVNLDPRSIEINTEMGVMIESTDLASLMADGVEANLPIKAWKVELDEKDHLTWTTIVNGEPRVEKSEPDVGLGRKIQAFFLRIMPESQL